MRFLFNHLTSPNGKDLLRLLRFGALVAGAIAGAQWLEWIMRSLE